MTTREFTTQQLLTELLRRNRLKEKTIGRQTVLQTQRRNPVHFMDSIDAWDLLGGCLTRLREDIYLQDPAFLDLLREQIQRHQRALRRIIEE